MRKRLGIAALLFISIWTCAGCKSRTDDSENMETTTKSLAVSGLEVKPEEGVEIIKDASLFTIPKENQKYRKEFDHQYWLTLTSLSTSSAAETKNSYYFLLDGFVYVYDKQSNQAALLCNDPTCEHGVFLTRMISRKGKKIWRR